MLGPVADSGLICELLVPCNDDEISVKTSTDVTSLVYHWQVQWLDLVGKVNKRVKSPGETLTVIDDELVIFVVVVTIRSKGTYQQKYLGLKSDDSGDETKFIEFNQVNNETCSRNEWSWQQVEA